MAEETAAYTAAVPLAFGKAAFVMLQAIFRTVPDIARLTWVYLCVSQLSVSCFCELHQRRSSWRAPWRCLSAFIPATPASSQRPVPAPDRGVRVAAPIISVRDAARVVKPAPVFLLLLAVVSRPGYAPWQPSRSCGEADLSTSSRLPVLSRPVRSGEIAA